jgi:hypothetical protein
MIGEIYMGMLIDRELVTAFINNTKDWDWDLNPTYKVDPETARALREELIRYKEQERNHEL